MLKEIGVEIEVVHLLWFVENFVYYAGRHYHEFALYFLMRLPTTCQYLTQPEPFLGEEGAIKLTIQWFPAATGSIIQLAAAAPLSPNGASTAI